MLKVPYTLLVGENFSVFLVDELQLNSTIVLFNDVLCGRRVRAEFIKTSNGDNNDDADDDDEAA